MPNIRLELLGFVKKVTVPLTVTRPIRLHTSSVNQRLPSGPAVIRYGVQRLVKLGRGRSGKVVNSAHPSAPALQPSAHVVDVNAQVPAAHIP